MKFHPDGPSIPDKLLESCDAGNVVFFCGAGVSINYGMPDFFELTEQVIEKCAPSSDSEIRKAMRTCCGGDSKFNLPFDQMFELLHQEYGKEFVNAIVAEIFRERDRDDQKDSPEHKHIRLISSSRSGLPQIVTTNFDRLFEIGPQDKKYESPNLPDLDAGQTVEGVTYLHGRLEDSTNKCPCNDRYVLSSSDHGLVYLADGRATNFIVKLFKKHTVVLVGYRAEDPVVKYLLLGLNKAGQLKNSNLFAFDSGVNAEIEAKWSNLGVSAIAYTEHCTLWSTMEAWAERVDDHKKWKRDIITQCHKDPKRLAPHERGQVTHILKTNYGAELFADADQKPHPEWICVIDPTVRLSLDIRDIANRLKYYFMAYYGIDDEAGNKEEKDEKKFKNNIIYCLKGHEDPKDFYQSSDLQDEGIEAFLSRLDNLIEWIVKSMDSPVIAWWTLRQQGINPLLTKKFKSKWSQLCNGKAKHIWNLILKCQRKTPPLAGYREDLVDNLESRIESERWTSEVMREFQTVSAPKLIFNSNRVDDMSEKLVLSWDEFNLGCDGLFEVEYPSDKLFDKKSIVFCVPNEQLLDAIKILEGNLNKASLLLQDIGMEDLYISTFYTDREVDLSAVPNIESKYVGSFIKLFDRLVKNNSELAKSYALALSENDKYFFRKIKLYALTKSKKIKENEVASILLGFDDESFWDSSIACQLLHLLVCRWKEFSEENRMQLADRLLAGANEGHYLFNYCENSTNKQYLKVATYVRTLESNDCELSADQRRRLADLKDSIPNWDDAHIISFSIPQKPIVRSSKPNESTDELINIPIQEVVPMALGLVKPEWRSNENPPFSGLVKQKPRKALLALMWAARSGSYRKDLWAEFINKFPKMDKDAEDAKDPEGVNDRLKCMFLHQLKSLPIETVAELVTNLGSWLETNLNDALKIESDLGWDVFDHIVDGIKFRYYNVKPTNGVTGWGNQSVNSNVFAKRDKFFRDKNSPIGKCASALINSIAQEEKDAQSVKFKQIKIRIDRLFAMKGEVSKQAITTIMSRLDCIYSVDPKWVKSRLLPMLKFEHPFSVLAWNGLLNPAAKCPQLGLLEQIKPKLIQIFPWVEGPNMYVESAEVAAKCLGHMRLHQQGDRFSITQCEMRDAIRKMSENTRHHFIDWLDDRANKSGDVEGVKQLVKEDWPRELKIKNTATTLRWIQLLKQDLRQVDTDNFSELYAVIKEDLSKIDSDKSRYEYSDKQLLDFFIRQQIKGQSIAGRYPEETMDLMYRTIGRSNPVISNLLNKVLEMIAKSKPGLTSDCRYQKLMNLSKSGESGSEDETQERD